MHLALPLFVATTITFALFGGAEADVSISQQVDLGTILDSPHIVITGEITARDVALVKKAIVTVTKDPKMWRRDGSILVNASLDLPGGDLFAAMQIGRLIRSKGVETWIAKGQTCSSACVLVFAGGVDRTIVPDGRLGLHRPTFTDYQSFAKLDQGDATAVYRKVAAAIREYFAEMGVPDALATRMLSVPNEDMLYLNADDADREMITGEDPAFAEWVRARTKERLGPDEVERLDQFKACYNQCISLECSTDPVVWCKQQLGIPLDQAP